MDYKEKYEQSLEKARKIHFETEFDYEKGMMEDIFPELKENENEDERMRKALKQGFFHYGNSFTTFGGINVVDIIAWLEKQGKQDMIPLDKAIKFLDEQLVDDKDEVTGEPFINFQNYGAFKETFISFFKEKMLEKQGEQESIDYNEELKKCRENPLYFIDKYVKFEERKPAWSKEDERMRKEIIDFLRLPHPQFVGKRDHEKWIDWLEKQGDNKECGNEWKVSPGLYKCTKRMFDGTPEGRLLFEPGNLYKCIKIHKCVTNNDVAVFESPYGLPVFLTDSMVREHFIKVQDIIEKH